MLALSVALGACEKSSRPTAAEPSGPTVIVEQPPAEQPEGSTEVTAGDSGAIESVEEGDFGRTKLVHGNVPCTSDADCVPAECCHPTSCVAAIDKPDCSATACTMDCRGGTMDCYGGCLCVEGKCAAKLWDPPGAI